MRKILSLALTAGLLAGLCMHPAVADNWHGHDIHHFHEHDFDHWRGGHWFQGFHNGHNGWWWQVDGIWYEYPTPVYPYPDPYIPPTVVGAPAPATMVTAGPTTLYYCANPAGYYPYVPQCTTAWQSVASTQAVAAPPQAVPAPVAAPRDPRAADMQVLNNFSAELSSISTSDPAGRAKLKVLSKRVEAFRKSLFHRDYNAMDVLHDAEDLQGRIAAQRSRTVLPGQ